MSSIPLELIKQDITFPPDCVESTQARTVKRRKYTHKHIGNVANIVMNGFLMFTLFVTLWLAVSMKSLKNDIMAKRIGMYRINFPSHITYCFGTVKWK